MTQVDELVGDDLLPCVTLPFSRLSYFFPLWHPCLPSSYSFRNFPTRFSFPFFFSQPSFLFLFLSPLDVLGIWTTRSASKSAPPLSHQFDLFASYPVTDEIRWFVCLFVDIKIPRPKTPALPWQQHALGNTFRVKEVQWHRDVEPRILLHIFLRGGDVGIPGLQLCPETLSVIISGAFHLYSNPCLSVVFSNICSVCFDRNQ